MDTGKYRHGTKTVVCLLKTIICNCLFSRYSRIDYSQLLTPRKILSFHCQEHGERLSHAVIPG